MRIFIFIIFYFILIYFSSYKMISEYTINSVELCSLEFHRTPSAPKGPCVTSRPEYFAIMQKYTKM